MSRLAWPLALTLAACGGGATTDWNGAIILPVGACRAVVCLPGAGGAQAGDNPTLESWCQALPGIVRRCEGDTCRALMTDVGEARAALDDVAARLEGLVFEDVNGQPTGAVTVCSAGLVGYSWGGVDALALAKEIGQRKSAPNRVSLTVLIDPFVPFSGGFVEVPEGLGQVVSFRHSIPDPDGCSAPELLGPYVGLPIRCAAESACAEFDLSKDGTKHDHCDMVIETGPAWFELFLGLGPDDLRRSDAVTVLRR